MLYAGYVVGSDGTLGRVGGVGGEVAAADEECALHVEERGLVFGGGEVGEEQAYVGVELVDGAVGLEAGTCLWHSFSACEGGGACVSCLGVYLHVVRVWLLRLWGKDIGGSLG